MKRILPGSGLGFCLLFSVAFSQDSDTLNVKDVVADVKKKTEAIKSYSAEIEVHHERQDGTKEKTTSSLTISRDHGWKVNSFGKDSTYTFITNFDVFYQYFPDQKQVIKMVPDNPVAKAMLKKPLTDLNPLDLMDQNTLDLKGTEVIEGETVFHITGTTSTQMVPNYPPVQRKIDFWVSTKDGLPRKTVENSGISTGTTLYKNLRTNIPATVEDFSFIVPPNVELIDANAEMKKMQNQTPPTN